MTEFTFQPKLILLQNVVNHSTEFGSSKAGIYDKGSELRKQSIRFSSFILCPFSFAVASKAENQINYELSSHIKLQQGRDFS